MQDDLTTLLTSLSWLPISLSIKAEVLTTASRGLYDLTPDCSSYSAITWSALGTLAFLLFPEHAISRGFKTCSFVCLEYSFPDLCMACYLTPFNHLLRNHLLCNSSWISWLNFHNPFLLHHICLFCLLNTYHYLARYIFYLFLLPVISLSCWNKNPWGLRFLSFSFIPLAVVLKINA